MTMKRSESERLFSHRIEFLISDIKDAFPPAMLEFSWQAVRNPNATDAEACGGLLGGILWTEVSDSTYGSLDWVCVRTGLSPRGLVCYLPMFMTRTLMSRDFGWFTELLLPVGLGLEDVVEQFSGSSLEDPSNYLRELFQEGVSYARAHLTAEQRECAARYIEITESYDIEDPSEEFQMLLKKYTDFWRSGA